MDAKTIRTIKIGRIYDKENGMSPNRMHNFYNLYKLFERFCSADILKIRLTIWKSQNFVFSSPFLVKQKNTKSDKIITKTGKL